MPTKPSVTEIKESKRAKPEGVGLKREERVFSGPKTLRKILIMAKSTTKTATAIATVNNNSTQKPKQTASKATDAKFEMIALSKLQLSPKNVRKSQSTEQDDRELIASIKTEGVKQNLVVHKGSGKTYLVDAGGRRLKALQTLAEIGHIDKDHPVACLIEDEQTATLTSTIENLHRSAMHPADQFDAFKGLIDEGYSEDLISTKFGVSTSLVRKRLRLANVAPEILTAFRDDKINLDCVMAFTIVNDHARQMTAWDGLKDGHFIHSQAIKNRLTATAYRANSKLGTFVTIEAYKAAGGDVSEDLFAEHETSYLQNPELVERLAQDKLETIAKDYIGDWKWVDVHQDLDFNTIHSFGSVSPLEVDPDPELLKQLDDMNNRYDEIGKMDHDDLTGELETEYEDLEEKIGLLEQKIEDERPFKDEDRDIAGVILSIGYDGELVVRKGLVRPEDIPQETSSNDGESDENMGEARVSGPLSTSPAPVADPAAAARRSEGLPNSLANDLRTSRHHILMAHLAADYEVAFDALLYTLCKAEFGRCFSSDTPIDLRTSDYFVPNADKLTEGSTSARMLAAIKDLLNLEWMSLDAPRDFKAMSELPLEEKQALFAYVIAKGVKAQLSNDNSASPIIEELGARMDVDVAACWRPTAVNYWGSVTKAHIATISGKLISAEYSDERLSEKKGEAAAAMELAFAENAAEASGLDKQTAAQTASWLPRGMAFAEAYCDDQIVDETNEDDHNNGDEKLPKFLQSA